MKISALLAAIWLGLAAVDAAAQTRVAAAERLQKAELDLRQATVELDKAEAAGRQGLLPTLELERIRTMRAKAAVEFEAALAVASGVDNRVMVKSALKQRDGKGQIHVSILLECTAERSIPTVDVNTDTRLGDYLRAPVNVFVSLRDDGTVIGDPYQVRLSGLTAGDSRRATFRLLKDVDTVEVVTTYRGLEDKTRVYLLKGEGGAGSLVVTAAQRSLDAELGGLADFAIRVDRFSDTIRKCDLGVAGLPPAIAYEFSTQDGQSRLSEVNFEEGVTAANLRLRLRLPAETTGSLVTDSPISFSVSCPVPGPPSKSPRATTANDRISLQVVPRGTGRLDVVAKTLFREVPVGDAADFAFTLRNSGTRTLDAVRVQVDPPSGWTKRIEPAGTLSLARNEEAAVRVRLVPTATVAVGDYEVRVRVEGTASGHLLPAEEKVARISVTSSTSGLLIGGISGVLLLLLAGIAIAGFRLARR